MEDLAIIGGGPAGLTAALYALRAGISAVILEPAGCGGQLAETPMVENYPGVAAGSGWQLAEAMKQQALEAGGRILPQRGIRLIREAQGYRVDTQGTPVTARAVILANGVKRRKLGVPGEEAFRGKGVSYCAVCDGGFFRGRQTAVVGGGNAALEDALYLAGICPKVYLIHRRDAFRGWPGLARQVTERENIQILWNTVVEEIRGDQSVDGLTVRQAGETRKLETAAVFIAIGLEPDNREFADTVALDPSGYIQAGEDCRTGAPGVFAAGDTRSKALRQIVTATADGAAAAAAALEFLRGSGLYNSGNSAHDRNKSGDHTQIARVEGDAER